MDPLITTAMITLVAAGLGGYLGWAYLDYRKMRGGRWW